MPRVIIVVIAIVLVCGAGAIFLRQENNNVLNAQTDYVKVTSFSENNEEIIIPARPKRVVFLTASSLEMWLAVGGSDSIVGRPRSSMVPKEVMNKLSDKVVDVGLPGGVSLEKVLLLKPDLVVGAPMVAVQQQMVEPLKQAGIPFLAMPNYSLKDVYAELRMFGRLTGNENSAEKEVKRIKDNIAVEAKRREGQTVKKVLLVWGTPASFSMVLPNSRQGDILRLAGGENIAHDPGTGVKFVPFSLEYAVEQNPDYVLFITHGEQDKLKTQMDKTLSESSSWQTIRAVKEGRVHILPPELFAVNPGPRVDEAVVFLSKLLYP